MGVWKRSMSTSGMMSLHPDNILRGKTLASPPASANVSDQNTIVSWWSTIKRLVPQSMIMCKRRPARGLSGTTGKLARSFTTYRWVPEHLILSARQLSAFTSSSCSWAMAPVTSVYSTQKVTSCLHFIQRRPLEKWNRSWRIYGGPAWVFLLFIAFILPDNTSVANVFSQKPHEWHFMFPERSWTAVAWLTAFDLFLKRWWHTNIGYS